MTNGSGCVGTMIAVAEEVSEKEVERVEATMTDGAVRGTWTAGLKGTGVGKRTTRYLYIN